MKTIVTIAALILLINTTSKASDHLPPGMLATPVLLQGNAGISGTGFYLQTTNKLYFITAKHVIYEDNGTNLLSQSAILSSFPNNELNPTNKIQYSINITNLEAIGKIHAHTNHDVVAIEVGSIQTNSSGGTEFVYSGNLFRRLDTGTSAIMSIDAAILRRFRDTPVGIETYIFGYPSSIGIKAMQQLAEDQPLLRKGVVAGKNPQKKTIIIDSPVYYGNSGGPVVEIDSSDVFTRNFSVIGIVSQFVPFAEEWENKKHRYINLTISNSGYSIIEPSDSILELISVEQPLSPR